MFTGLIQDVGQVLSLSRAGDFATLTLSTVLADETMKVGDSLAVNGVCLTAVDVTHGRVSLEVVSETLSRTVLGRLPVGGRVNLERPLRVGDRIDGHLVQGHVDGVGRVRSGRRVGPAVLVEVEVPASLRRYIVEKGSVAVDGVSLTVAGVTATSFTVSLVPHTLKATTLERLDVGREVNIEADVIAKYVEGLVGERGTADSSSGVDRETLSRFGFGAQ